MNERIKELAEQAGGEFYEGFAGGTNFVKFAEDDFEKFAELLVREWVMLCDKVYEHNDNVKIQAGATFCREDIKEHFGVEE